jgi:hypothetical protein
MPFFIVTAVKTSNITIPVILRPFIDPFYQLSMMVMNVEQLME